MNSIVQVPYDATVRLMLGLLERNLLPHAVVRRLTRLLLAGRLRSGYRSSAHIQLSDLLHFVQCTLLNYVTFVYLLFLLILCSHEHIAVTIYDQFKLDTDICDNSNLKIHLAALRENGDSNQDRRAQVSTL